MAQDANELGQSQQSEIYEEAQKADLIADRDRKKETKVQRPWQVAVLSMLMFLSSAWALPLIIFAEVEPGISLAYGIYLAAAAGTGVLSSIIIWMMRRWGLLVYAGISILNIVVTLITGDFSVLLIIVPLAVLGFGWLQRSAFQVRSA